MLIDSSRVLPVPGPVWGTYPLRPADDLAPPFERPRWRSDAAHLHKVAREALGHSRGWSRLGTPARATALQQVRTALRRHGLRDEALESALGIAAGCAAEVLGWTPRDTQRMAAAALLTGRMAEMATGEGKTLAMALAAAVGGLAGVPVHVVTANDYLAERDARQMAPLFVALKLRVAHLDGHATDAAKRAVYGHDIVYATAKNLAFDFLRDRLALGSTDPLARVAQVNGRAAGAVPVMRGLCMALLDEADSILLDEAEVPLILSRAAPHAARRALLWQALALARRLEARGAMPDFTLHPADRIAVLTPAGEAHLARLAAPLGGAWLRPRYRREAVVTALAGLHLYRRDVHYLVRDGQIELLDEVTGRATAGRVWSRGLQTIVALKEDLSAPDESETLAQITFQRFFQRYWRLAGLSGTLFEARGELREVYGTRVVRVPLHTPCRRIDLPLRRFDDAVARFEAAADRAAALSASGRPVLIGTRSVADAQAVSNCLQRRGTPHQVLSALHDAHEAEVVAAAGRAGQVTVATRMAGRGTDIELDAAARAAGGLHVLSCQDNPSRRLDRQLAGRAGRHGDPGSAEAWLLPRNWQGVGEPADPKLARWNLPTLSSAPPWLLATVQRSVQHREERRREALRRGLLQQDLAWERRLSFAGSPG